MDKHYRDYDKWDDWQWEHGKFDDARALDALMAKPQAKLQHDVVVWRGLSGRFVPKKGAVFTDHGFMSTSFSLNVAEGFTEGGYGSRAPHYILRIAVKKGQRGLAMFKQLPKDRVARDERELLLPRSTKFKVVRKREFRPERVRDQWGWDRDINAGPYRALNQDAFYTHASKKSSYSDDRVVILDVEIIG